MSENYRQIAEDYFQKELLPDEVVHHIDGDKTNNNPENLVIMKRSQHSSLHGSLYCALDEWSKLKAQDDRIIIWNNYWVGIQEDLLVEGEVVHKFSCMVCKWIDNDFTQFKTKRQMIVHVIRKHLKVDWRRIPSIADFRELNMLPVSPLETKEAIDKLSEFEGLSIDAIASALNRDKYVVKEMLYLSK